VRLDKKLLLIAPTIVLVFVIAGMIYATLQLRLLSDAGSAWKERSDFITAVEQGQKTLDQRQALGILRYSLDTEAKRTEAVAALRDLLAILSGIAVVSCCVLTAGIQKVPREHWPRFRAGQDQLS